MGRDFLRAILTVVVTLLAAYVLVRVIQAWQPNFGHLKADRLRQAQSDKGPVNIALAWVPNDYNSGFLRGVETAVTMLNHDGGILGRPVRTKLFSGPDVQAAREIAASTQYSVVIGHETSGGALPASVTYNRAGILYIAPFATHPDLTIHGFDLVLRSVPDDREMVLTLAAQGALQGVKRLAVLSVRSAYGRSLRIRVEQYAEDNGIHVGYSTSYSESKADFRQVAYELKGQNVDAIFIGDSVPRAAFLIHQLRAQDINVPILGTDGLDDCKTLWSVAGSGSAGTFVISVYDPPGEYEGARAAVSTYEERFVREYKLQYRMLPDVWAASGFDAVMLYAQGAKKSKTTDPLVICSMLKFGGPSEGLMGSYSFDKDGNAVGKKLIMKMMVSGEFRPFKQEGELLKCQ